LVRISIRICRSVISICAFADVTMALELKSPTPQPNPKFSKPHGLDWSSIVALNVDIVCFKADNTSPSIEARYTRGYGKLCGSCYSMHWDTQHPCIDCPNNAYGTWLLHVYEIRSDSSSNHLPMGRLIAVRYQAFRNRILTTTTKLPFWKLAFGYFHPK
jgi:hypothetical protein